MKYTFLISSLLAVSSASAALTSISAITHTGGNLDSVTISGTEYTSLTAATSLIQNFNNGGYLGIGTAPTDINGALDGLNVNTGTLNTDFEAQFGGSLTDTSKIILMNNQSTGESVFFWGTDVTIYALDATGTRLGSSNLDLVPLLDGGGADASPILYTGSFQRSTSGTLNRNIFGAAFSLTDLGLEGLSATGIELLTTGVDSGGYTLDTQVIGLAAVPEPSSFALLAGSLAFASIMLKRRH